MPRNGAALGVLGQRESVRGRAPALGAFLLWHEVRLQPWSPAASGVPVLLSPHESMGSLGEGGNHFEMRLEKCWAGGVWQPAGEKLWEK